MVPERLRGTCSWLLLHQHPHRRGTRDDLEAPKPTSSLFFGFLLVAESVFVGRVFEIKSRRNMHAVVYALCYHRSWASLLSSPPFDIFLLKKTPKPVHQHILAFLKLSVEYDGK